jgi:serine phosphatase RsbU (regulator of sigma subunit)
VPPDGEPSRGEAVIADLLKRSHALRPTDIPAVTREAARRLGGIDAFVYVVDRDQRFLIRLDDPGERLDIDATVAGEAFRIRARRETGDCAWLPLLDGADRLGVLRVDLDGETDELRMDRLEMLSTVIALFIESKAHFGDAIEIASRTRPMSLAAELRWALLPPLTFRNDHVEVAAMLEPAYEVAGDAFDYSVGEHTTQIALFDAMGHGLLATRMANLAVAAYRNARRGRAGLADTARAIDDVLAEQFGRERFVTALLLELDMRSGEVRFVTAGHPLPLLLRDGRVVGQVDGRRTVPLGLGIDPPVNELTLEVGDRLLLFTDGMTDAQAEDGTEFGVARLAQLLNEAVDTAEIPSETARRLTHSVLDHARRLRDDATLLLLGWPAAQPS